MINPLSFLSPETQGVVYTIVRTPDGVAVRARFSVIPLPLPSSLETRSLLDEEL